MAKRPKYSLNAYSMIRSVPVEQVIQYSNQLYPDIRYDVEASPGIEAIRPLFARGKFRYPQRYVMAQVTSNWVLLSDDCLRSDGCATQMHNLHRLFGCEGFTIHYGELGTVFTYYTRETKRHIHAISENGRWEFYQSGPVLPFEHAEYYAKRRITDRFNVDIFKEYQAVLGLSDVSALLGSSPKVYVLTVRSVQPATV